MTRKDFFKTITALILSPLLIKRTIKTKKRHPYSVIRNGVYYWVNCSDKRAKDKKVYGLSSHRPFKTIAYAFKQQQRV